jgi:hypothetical protein
MRRFLAVFANFSVCAEAASQAYSLTLDLSTSKRHFLCFIKMSEDPEDVESVSCPSQILLDSRTWYSAKSGPKLTSFASTMRETMMISVMEQKGSTTMTTDRLSLMTCYSGWDNYQISLARTVARLTHEQLAWRPTQEHRSVGELVQHIIMGNQQGMMRTPVLLV